MVRERLNIVYRHLPCSLKAGSILSRAIEGTPVAKFKTEELRMYSYIETSEPLNIYKEEEDKKDKRDKEEVWILEGRCDKQRWRHWRTIQGLQPSQKIGHPYFAYGKCVLTNIYQQMFNERLSNIVYRHLPCSLKAGSILSRAIEGTPVAKFETRELRMFSYIETSEPLNIYKEEDNKDKKEEAEESSSSPLKDEEVEEEENNEDEDNEEEVAVVINTDR
uniref:Uncharacterized protein n=1 Tax=Oryza barthii TaxID=65489 RepID=A0A0D3HUP0_9ORYZ